MTVFTIVTGPVKTSALPFKVVMASTPAVEIEMPACAMMVPCIVPPPRIPLMVAAVPTCQNTFLACAPFTRSILRCDCGVPTVNVVAIWKTQDAFGSPLASRVKIAHRDGVTAGCGLISAGCQGPIS